MLVIDDVPVIADTLVEILKRNGYLAFARYSSAKALEFCQLIKPDWVVSDVVMPGMNGIQLAGELEKLIPECKIILISGNTTAKDLLDREKRNGDLEILPKPISPHELLNRLEER